MKLEDGSSMWSWGSGHKKLSPILEHSTRESDEWASAPIPILDRMDSDLSMATTMSSPSTPVAAHRGGSASDAARTLQHHEGVAKLCSQGLGVQAQVQPASVKHPAFTIAPYQRTSSPRNEDAGGMDVICCRHFETVPTAHEHRRDVGAHRTPEWRRVRDWPAVRWPTHKDVCGDLSLKCSPDGRRAARAVCSVKDGVLSLAVPREGGSGSAVVQVPVTELAVGLRRSRTSMLILAKLCENKVYDEVYCFVGNHSERNKWTAVFRRMGIPIFDVH